MSPSESRHPLESELPVGARPESTSTDFAALYTTLRQRVHALCFGITRDAADAEDAVQETFVCVQRGLSGFRGEARLSTWVYRIAVTTSLSIRARSTRHAGLAVDEALVDPCAAPDDVVDARRRHAQLERAMGRLSAEHRTVLTLFALEGLSHREIAEVLDLKEGTVWSRLHLARKRLAQLLEAPEA